MPCAPSVLHRAVSPLSAGRQRIPVLGRRPGARPVAEVLWRSRYWRITKQVLPHLHTLVSRDPFNERAHACLMIALAGGGQQATAWRSTSRRGVGSMPISGCSREPCWLARMYGAAARHTARRTESRCSDVALSEMGLIFRQRPGTHRARSGQPGGRVAGSAAAGGGGAGR